ncbi:AGR002Wp [Eremothecium gossypii ATCC 10895]|uniref:Citrate synthase n=1 Tax=Eremothecium gossypii (strain ATCC 10895 / CBS 109.51 / FGSC 9923 / NRRL Y-1056) TaxID=284811 RepID=Q750F3_EREGS|nr:AGR002Wp [Eremothecium gossypii ATCC 10895]AAS54491.1 AGR002Wp [Eremothecium gossypii ATCC 10895]AEY98823.1 FAGR002Wp [Eremothecium gossypii FDAG1]
MPPFRPMKLCRSITRSSTARPRSLKEAVEQAIPLRRHELKELKAYSNMQIDSITVGSIIGGMRNNKSMLWQGTTLDPFNGIKFQGKTIQECQQLLPCSPDKQSKKTEFMPESMLWLLMTGEIPKKEEAFGLMHELSQRGKTLPPFVEHIIDSLPRTMHPMTQLAVALASLNSSSTFCKNYQDGVIGKEDYWHYIFEDALNLIALLPQLVGKIYSNVTNEGMPLGYFNPDRDWSYNIASLLGMTYRDSVNKRNLTKEQCDDFTDLVRLYCGIHVDHEGGNVSAHATHLVGSALSDPYLSYSAGVMGLAGPLHGLAAQEVVRFLVDMAARIDSPDNESQVSEYLWALLNSGKVVPGYGHAVLRKPDPRFDAMLRFVEARPQEFQGDRYVQLMRNLSKYAPKVLTEHGKTKNPFPNVDSASGVLFYHYGIHDLLFVTVIFACSRAIGPLTQLVWDRILGLPIERPKSVDMATLRRLVNQNLRNAK